MEEGKDKKAPPFSLLVEKRRSLLTPSGVRHCDGPLKHLPPLISLAIAKVSGWEEPSCKDGLFPPEPSVSEGLRERLVSLPSFYKAAMLALQ